MFLDGLARPVGIGMERHQSLGLGPVAEPLPHDGADNSLVVGPLGQHGLELGPERETPDILQQGVDSFAALIVVDELEQLLEHTRSGARSGHELHDGTRRGRRVVTGHGCIGRRRAEHRNAVAGRSGPHDPEKGKTAPEIGDLPLDRSGRQPMPGDLLEVFL